MPVRVFWLAVRQMHRIKAAENLRWARNLSVPNMTEDSRRGFIDEQIRTLGVIAEEEPRLDREGLAKLKQLG